MTVQNVLSDSKTLALPYPGSTAVLRGDFLYWDASIRLVRPLTSKATLASEILDQAAVAALFVGVSWDVRLASEVTQFTASDWRVVQIEGVFDADCPSQIFYPGDLVGPTWNGLSSLANQAVTKVNNVALAIGVVIHPYGGNYGSSGLPVTRVRCRLLSRWCWDLAHSRPGLGGSQGTGATVLADAAAVLTLASNPILSMAPTVARNVTLPDEARSAGFVFYFTNSAAGAVSVTFLGSAGGAILGNGVVPQNKTAYLWSNGTAWSGLVSA